MSETVALWLTLAVFLVTYAGLAVGRVPWLRTDRTGIALVGAAAVLALGLLNFEAAVKAVDFGTIVLLLGMMVVVGFLRRAGFFELLANVSLGRLHSPAALLAAVMLLSGVLSALLVNDVVCLALTPLVLQLAGRMRLDPRPHLIGLAVASNVGSTATLTGNPQNMIIGGLSQIAYGRFAAKLAPVAVIGLLAAYGVTWLVYRKTLRGQAEEGQPADDAREPGKPDRTGRRAHRILLIRTLVVTAGAVVLFFAGANMAVTALGAAALLLLSRVKPGSIYEQVDWGLLVMFAGLFVVVHAFEVHVLSHADVAHWQALQESPVGLLSVVSAALSNLVSNVPAVLLFKPIIPAMPAGQQETAWLALAMSSTLAGNLTILGSVANLIVVENAKARGTTITLLDYCRVGIPVTALTLLVGMAWLQFVPY